MTICVQNREHLFGHIANDQMVLNVAGLMVDQWCQKIPEKFPDVQLDAYIIMPNHFHAIVTKTVVSSKNDNDILEELGDHVGSPLHGIIGWFKTMTTNEYIRQVKATGWPPFDRRLWQRNYYEHIIRTNKAYQLIDEYITSNPPNWLTDKLYS